MNSLSTTSPCPDTTADFAPDVPRSMARIYFSSFVGSPFMDSFVGINDIRISDELARDLLLLSPSPAHLRRRYLHPLLHGGVDGGLISRIHLSLDPLRPDLDIEDNPLVHGVGHGLCPAHAAHAGSQYEFPFEARLCELHLRERGEGFVGALKDALGPNVDPAPSGHWPYMINPISS